MDIEEAKKLMELQSCITHFCDKFLNEVESMPDSEIKTLLSNGMREVIGINFTEAMMPIIQKHSSLNPYGDNPIATSWFKNAKKRVLENEV